MTPIYETQKDRDNANEVASLIGKMLGLDVMDTSTTSPIDFELYREGNLWAVMEVKCRNVRFGTYEDYRIDKSKIDKLHNMSLDRNCTGIIAVKCLDKIGVSGTSNFIKHASAGEIVRLDRNDKNDADRAYCMPWDKFNKVIPTTLLETISA